MPAAVFCVECQAGPLSYSGRGRPQVTCSPECHVVHQRRRERLAYAAKQGDKAAQMAQELPRFAVELAAPEDAELSATEPLTGEALAALAALTVLTPNRSAGFGDGDGSGRSRPGRRPVRPFG